MKSNLGTRSVTEINFTNVIAIPVDNDAQSPIVVERVVKKESALSAQLILVAGILFWAHGNATHDAWFQGEEVTGQAITGFYIGVVGLMCCCCVCAAGCIASDAHNSEIEIPTSAPRKLMADLFKSVDNSEKDETNDASISYNV